MTAKKSYFSTKFDDHFLQFIGDQMYKSLFKFVQIWHFCSTMSRGLLFPDTVYMCIMKV